MKIVDFFARFFFAKSVFGQIFLSILKNPTTFFVLKKYTILRTYVKIIEYIYIFPCFYGEIIELLYRNANGILGNDALFDMV
jgi:hypothetical protein